MLVTTGMIRGSALDVHVDRRCNCDVRRVEHAHDSTWIEQVGYSLWLEAMTFEAVHVTPGIIVNK